MILDSYIHLYASPQESLVKDLKKWSSIRISHDTAEFAVAAIKRWLVIIIGTNKIDQGLEVHA